MDACPQHEENKQLIGPNVPMQGYQMILDYIPANTQLPQCGDHLESLKLIAKSSIKRILKQGLRLPGQGPEVTTVIDTVMDDLFDNYWTALSFSSIWPQLLGLGVALVFLIIIAHWLFGIFTGVYILPHQLFRCGSRYSSRDSLEADFERPPSPGLTRLEQIREANRYAIHQPVLQPLRLSLLEKVSPTPPYPLEKIRF